MNQLPTKQILLLINSLMGKNEFNRQAMPILSYHSKHEQLEQKSEHTSQQFLRQLLYQDVSSVRNSMEYLNQRTLATVPQRFGQTVQRIMANGVKIGARRSKKPQGIEWQRATRLNTAAEQSLMALFPMLVASEG